MSRAPVNRNSPISDRAPIGVLIVDDQRVVREGVAKLISCAPLPIRDMGTAATCAEALRVADRLRPEIVVLDVDLGDEDGLTLIGHLGTAARVVVLTSHTDAATRARALQLGAHGFVQKHQPAADLLQAIVDLVAIPRMGEDKAPRRGGESSGSTLVASSDAQLPKHR